jgi:hypothetical protein
MHFIAFKAPFPEENLLDAKGLLDVSTTETIQREKCKSMIHTVHTVHNNALPGDVAEVMKLL